jgi:hypothetical protein
MLEKVRLQFCKLLLNLKTSTANCLVYGELGRFHYLFISSRDWFLIGQNLYRVNRLSYVLLLTDKCFIYLVLKMFIFNGYLMSTVFSMNVRLTYIWNSQNFINERLIKENKLSNAYGTSSNEIGMMIFKLVQKPLII